MVLVDYNQCIIANLFAVAQKELQSGGDLDDIINLVRHVVLNTLKSYKKKYSKQYGDVVICCDAKRSWRKDMFPNYKANRKASRDSSKIDWSLLFEALYTINPEL